MDTDALVNRFQILFYSALISILSGINRLRARILPLPGTNVQKSGEQNSETVLASEPLQPQSRALSWQAIQNTLASLLLWAVLGFAAGFLMGMIRPW
jgi:hypothetical protein